MFKQFVCFSGVGVVGTVAHYSVLVFCVELLTIDPVISSILGFLAGAVVNYILNYHFTFKSKACHNETGPKFFFVVVIGFCINYLVMYALINLLALNYILSQIISTALVLFWNFFASRFWVFNHGKMEKNT